MKSHTRFVATLLCVFSCLPPLASGAFAKDAWTRLQSKNFTIIGNASERDMSKVAVRLEQFREALTRVLPKSNLGSSVPTTVVVFKSRDSFKPFLPIYKGKARNNVAGYFSRGADDNYIALTTENYGPDPFHAIFHEYTHFLIDNNLRRAPVWLHEGLAEVYSTLQAGEENQKLIIGAPIGQHIAELRGYTRARAVYANVQTLRSNCK